MYYAAACNSLFQMSASASYLTESTNKFHAVATVQALSPAQQLENLVITFLYQIKTILLI